MAKRKSSSDSTTDQAVKQISDLVDGFCKEHLNKEYADLCRKLTEKLARKRPTPLIGGKPNSWASGIVRTIGWVNFLDDKTQKPHMKLTAIDKAFGVGELHGMIFFHNGDDSEFVAKKKGGADPKSKKPKK